METLSDRRAEALEIQLRRLEKRVAHLEAISRVASTATEDAVEESPDHPSAAASPSHETLFDLALGGRFTLILGGAFLLRAAADSAAVPLPAAVATGLGYALFWLWLAHRTARRERPHAAIVHALAAAVIAYSIVWEATVRFHLFSATGAAIAMSVVAVMLLAVARIDLLQPVAWMAAIGAMAISILLATDSRVVIPFLISLSLVGVVTAECSIRREWSFVASLVGVEGNLFAACLIVTVLFDRSAHAPDLAAAALMLYATMWIVPLIALAWPGRLAAAQSVAAAAIGIGGAALIAGSRNVSVTATGTEALVIAVVSAVLELRSERNGAASLIACVSGMIGTTLLLAPLPRTIAWALGAVAAAELARRRSATVFAIESALLAIAALALATSHSPIAVAATVVCTGVAFLRTERYGLRLALLAVVTAGTASIAISLLAPDTPLGRTIVLSAIATLLALARRTETSQLAFALLVIIGIQVLAEDFPSGKPAVIFAALAAYGSAMLLVSRLRRRRFTEV